MTAFDDSGSEPAILRTVKVTYFPPISGTKVVRFQGFTFGELQQRMIAAKVPGVHSKSYIELLLPNEGFVCPLPDEALPSSAEITVSVHAELTGAAPQGLPASPVYSEMVTGQPVPAEDGQARRGHSENSRLTETDKHFARKEAKMKHKIAKISAKLGALHAKHGTFATSDEDGGDRSLPHAHYPHGPPPPFGRRHHHHHGHHHHGWRHGGGGPPFPHPHHSHHPHPPPSHSSAQPAEGRPVLAVPGVGGYMIHGEGLAPASRGDPSGANCQAEFVKSGKA